MRDQQWQRTGYRAKVGVGQHCRHSVELSGAADIDGSDACVGVRTAQNGGVKHVGQLDIVDVGAGAGQETPVLFARDRCAKDTCGHTRSPSTSAGSTFDAGVATASVSIWRTAATMP